MHQSAPCIFNSHFQIPTIDPWEDVLCLGSLVFPGHHPQGQRQITCEIGSMVNNAVYQEGKLKREIAMTLMALPSQRDALDI
jgi:hypothetical protein